MDVWFLGLAVLGVYRVAQHPHVLRALSSGCAIELALGRPGIAFVILGSRPGTRRKAGKKPGAELEGAKSRSKSSHRAVVKASQPRKSKSSVRAFAGRLIHDPTARN
jgi:hypothetical protein